MAKVSLTTLFMLLTLTKVQGACDPKVIDKIKTLWNRNPPEDNLSKLVGKLTYLYTPSFYLNETEELKCLQIKLDADTVTSTEYVVYENASMSFNFDYDVVEEERGIITQITTYYPEDHLYVVYLDKGVFGFYQCGDDYPHYVGVAALDYESNNAEMFVSITEAEIKLSQLGISFGPKLKTDCNQ